MQLMLLHVAQLVQLVVLQVQIHLRHLLVLHLAQNPVQLMRFLQVVEVLEHPYAMGQLAAALAVAAAAAAAAFAKLAIAALAYIAIAAASANHGHSTAAGTEN